MTDKSGTCTATPSGTIASSSRSRPSDRSAAESAASFLTGELLLRAEARAGDGLLVPSDLHPGLEPVRAASWLPILCFTPGCFPATDGFMRRQCRPDQPVPTDPDTRPRQPDKPDMPGGPDAPDQ